MKPITLISIAVIATVLNNPSSQAAPPKVESQDVASTDADVIYVVSDRGVHLAAKTRKGSRFVVTIDGVAGPKFDDLLTETLICVDPRPHRFVGSVASRHAGDQRTARPVIFSKDGNHHAYVCRMGEEWVVIHFKPRVSDDRAKSSPIEFPMVRDDHLPERILATHDDMTTFLPFHDKPNSL